MYVYIYILLIIFKFDNCFCLYIEHMVHIMHGLNRIHLPHFWKKYSFNTYMDKDSFTTYLSEEVLVVLVLGEFRSYLGFVKTFGLTGSHLSLILISGLMSRGLQKQSLE